MEILKNPETELAEPLKAFVEASKLPLTFNLLVNYITIESLDKHVETVLFELVLIALHFVKHNMALHHHTKHHLRYSDIMANYLLYMVSYFITLTCHIVMECYGHNINITQDTLLCHVAI